MGPDKQIFRLVVISNGITWPSLAAKMAEVVKFFAPVIDLRVEIVYTKLTPVFTDIAIGLPRGTYMLDFGWFDQNVSGPYAGDADGVIFLVGPNDNPSHLPTYGGIMTYNNLGPWEITIFPHDENAHIYQNGIDYGNYFVNDVKHELSHLLYAMSGQYDRTHSIFPMPGQVIRVFPDSLLWEVNLFDRNAFLDWAKRKCLYMLRALRMMPQKQILSVTADSRHVA